MCFDDKVEKLADMISSEVKFDSIEEAEAFANSYKLPMDHHVTRQIQNMAELFFEQARHFGIEVLMRRIGTDFGTKHSAAREAIRLCAKRYVERERLKELADLGNIDRREIKVLA